ncbi:DUF6875 domain-containing protein [Kitasatospora sp. NBC_01300]|uniref:DUF6875 domain-containing protein n=1 Tax=Kitasatospora sp. NBC_01300 TaxID=2903574 RepID=UPI00352F913E|nr:hypothetical protein OG556_00840 [Kitasatospora sp. NBC_01300]WSK08270.1 hypothetical protein OG556_32880 [Kitasatospora sp. NBC_01300]
MTTHTLDIDTALHSGTALRIDTALRVYSAEQIDAGAADHHPEAAEILAWSRRFLTTAHPDLGRSGPVCPYTQPSLRRGLFHIAVADTGADGDLPALVGELRAWYDRLLADLTEESDRELLTVLLVLPGLDRADSTALDEAQRKAKDEFVEQGLMIGQFHPVCEEGGLWNHSFRPLRAPVPLLAVRKLLVFDLPFLVADEAHLAHYLARFAPQVPARIRDQLVSGMTEHRRTARLTAA